ncbi:MAG TPA: carbamoyltransferase C-terminal domain-containing protein [Candidatus Pacearchaeota archaeon]|nr:carbamoyltransferase C-terminal domain-containing protein [Candidatus Pacearchaeota archaeon]
MKILGIHYGHNATVALMEDGKITFACSEERFNRLKNSKGFPRLTLDYIYKNLAKPEEIDLAVLFQRDYLGYLDLKNAEFKSVRDFSFGNASFNLKYDLKNHILSRLPCYYGLRAWIGRLLTDWRKQQDAMSGESEKYFSQELGLPKEKIIACGHHTSHAYAAALNLDPIKKYLIFTMDGEGDGLSSLVNIFQDFRMETISKNPIEVSLGYFYSEITKFLGMTPNEHEFKVMGLAPYAKQEKAWKLYEKYKNLIWLDEDLQFRSKIRMNRLAYFLVDEFYAQRFDNVAAFAQIFVEEKTIEWVKAWIKKTDIHDLAVGGGVFMNVKMSQKILELPEVNSLFVMPSGGDESTPIGACYYGYLEFCRRKNIKPQPQPLADLYLGNSYSDSAIENFLKDNGYFEKYAVQKFDKEFEIERQIAKLLAENKVVARFKGRMEWGARALGNRSILANPASRDTIKIINEMIKNRDFWMPFAASILKEDADRYLVFKKPIKAPYMSITFDTKELAHTHILAALHPYDLTSRPQLVEKSWNPEYHALISEFKNLTGIGAVLNTSFNLHGEPNVESPKDALHTFEDSGLPYLALENFLIAKK